MAKEALEFLGDTDGKGGGVEGDDIGLRDLDSILLARTVAHKRRHRASESVNRSARGT
jgi:hypothetical protein